MTERKRELDLQSFFVCIAVKKAMKRAFGPKSILRPGAKLTLEGWIAAGALLASVRIDPFCGSTTSSFGYMDAARHAMTARGSFELASRSSGTRTNRVRDLPTLVDTSWRRSWSVTAMKPASTRNEKNCWRSSSICCRFCCDRKLFCRYHLGTMGMSATDDAKKRQRSKRTLVNSRSYPFADASRQEQ